MANYKNMGIVELRQLAEQGNAEAQYQLGSMYLDENNPDEAVKWLTKSASQGYGFAQDCLSICYEAGIGGVKKDKIQANFWGKKAQETEMRGGYILNADIMPKCVQAFLRAIR